MFCFDMRNTEKNIGIDVNMCFTFWGEQNNALNKGQGHT